MITEQEFINNLTKYNTSSVEFDTLEYINEVLGGTIRPIVKRGIAPNEFTIVKISGYEEVNNDTVLALFDVIRPGPKELDRMNTHSIVGRKSQAIMLLILLDIGNRKYLLLQKRNPVCIGFEESTEIFRDYIEKDISLDTYLVDKFGKILEEASSYEIVPTGHFWENTGIIGVNVMSSLVNIKLKSSTKIEDLLKEVNTYKLRHTGNIIGERELILEPLSKVTKAYSNFDNKETSYYLGDMFSITALSMLFRVINETE